ncbi:MAG: hypothetical protein CVT98_05065 [Bacteroidetes bacterium HGW-Bacteroidetes-15]|nr:MAG: hypothetical protein CVT98_05065 [Bacteroidetes bacterium HGW-Bacteroidetes-15]
MLHLQGPNNTTFGFGGGWRRWMSTGIFIGEHSDGMYVGMKPVVGTTNRSNAVINWNDDPFAGVVDKLSFVFTQANNGNGTGTNPINSNSLQGYEFMLLAPSTTVFNSQGTGEGTIGVGPVFTDAAPPQSRLHINAEERMNNWLQISNQTGTGQLASDGLRIGINGDNNTNVNGNALIYNQETRHLLFSTANNTNFVNIANGTTLERMRITSIAAPTNLASGGYGVFNPANLSGNLTRVAISHNPNSPVTRPLSLLHLGYNTGLVGFTPTSTDGWRNWMDIGTFTNNGTDNMYVGLKQEAGAFPANDKNDAVINWGDNDASSPLNGPDNLRFIFTSTTTGAGNSPANTNNGLEVARMVPALATTLPAPNFGMVGIGNFAPSGLNTGPADVVNAKLDIDGDLRIRTVTQDSNLLQVLVIDSNDKNRVHWRNINSFSLGNFCSDPQNPITDNYEIPLNNFNYHFTGQGTAKTNVGIGLTCATTPLGKLHVVQTANNTLLTSTFGISVAGRFDNLITTQSIAVGVMANAQSNNPNSINIGVWGSAPTGTTNFAGFFDGNVQVNGSINATGTITPSDQQFKQNIQPLSNASTLLSQLAPKTFNFDSTNFIGFNFDTKNHMGLIAQEVSNVFPNLVKESILPAEYDTLGNQISAAVNYKSLNYQELIPLLIAGFNEQQTVLNNKDSIIDNLETRLATLEACINQTGICNNHGGNGQDNHKENNQTVTLQNTNAIVLDQNLPNPFAESTQINYVIPADVQKATLLFYDMNGRIINEVTINERGNGSLTVYGANLEKGIYTYSLIADGKLIATKKMVKK